MPFLLACCEQSEIVTDVGIAAFRAIVPQLEIVTIAGVGHILVGDQHDRFADRIGDFIARLP